MSAAVAQARGVAAVVVAAAVLLGVLTGSQPVFGAVFVLAAVFAGVFFTSSARFCRSWRSGSFWWSPSTSSARSPMTSGGYRFSGVALGGRACRCCRRRRPLGQLVSGWDVVVFRRALLLAFGINGV